MIEVSCTCGSSRSVAGWSEAIPSTSMLVAISLLQIVSCHYYAERREKRESRETRRRGLESRWDLYGGGMTGRVRQIEETRTLPRESTRAHPGVHKTNEINSKSNPHSFIL